MICDWMLHYLPSTFSFIMFDDLEVNIVPRVFLVPMYFEPGHFSGPSHATWHSCLTLLNHFRPCTSGPLGP